MKNLLLLITLITLGCIPQKEPVVTYYNHDSTDGYILKIVSTQEGIISQEFEKAKWEVKPVTDTTVSQSDYEKLCNLVRP
jgi:hypothetical protein